MPYLYIRGSTRKPFRSGTNFFGRCPLPKVALKQKTEKSLKDMFAVMSEGESVVFRAPFFHRHLQQFFLTLQDYNFDYEDLADPVALELAILKYLANPLKQTKMNYLYISKELEAFLLAPVQPKVTLGVYTTPDYARPMSRYMALLLRHYAASTLFDVSTTHGCEAFYSYVAVQLVPDLCVPFSLIPDYVFDFLAAPHPSFAANERTNIWLSKGMVDAWRHQFAAMPLDADDQGQRLRFFLKLCEAIATNELDHRLLPTTLIKSLLTPTEITGGASVTCFMAEILQSETPTPAATDFFANILPQLKLPASLLSPHLKLAKNSGFGLVPAKCANARAHHTFEVERANSIDLDGKADITLIDPGSVLDRPPIVVHHIAQSFAQSTLKVSILNNAGNSRSAGHGRTAAYTFSANSKSPINLIDCGVDRVADDYLRVGLNNMRDRYNIGYVNCDTGRLSDAHRAGLPLLDEIWAPTQFVYETFKNNDLGIAVRLLPPTISKPAISGKMDRGYFGLRNGVFYFVFICHSVPQLLRQNPDAVVQAFHQAFPRTKKDVGLIIKIQNSEHRLGPADSSAFINLKREVAGDDRIFLLTQKYRDIELTALINAADCYVSLHRSEGLGLPMLEAMALRKPLIATGWSGNADFTTQETACPVTFELIQIDPTGFGRLDDTVGNLWADASIAHAAEWMEKISGDKSFCRTLGLKGQQFVEHHYGIAVTLKAYEKRLSEIRAMIGLG